MSRFTAVVYKRLALTVMTGGRPSDGSRAIETLPARVMVMAGAQAARATPGRILAGLRIRSRRVQERQYAHQTVGSHEHNSGLIMVHGDDRPEAPPKLARPKRYSPDLACQNKGEVRERPRG